MNRSSIEWTDYTWNPVTGCEFGCDYCYGRRMVNENPSMEKYYPNGYDPTYHPERLNQPLEVKKPSKIFVVDMGDLFGDWVSAEWIQSVIDITNQAPQHIFQFLTKNPKRYAEFIFPSNCWLGTTIDYANEGYERLLDLTGSISVLRNPHCLRFGSFEPLMEDVSANPFIKRLDWIIIGKMTGEASKKKQYIKNMASFKENATKLLDLAHTFHQIPTFIKNNAEWTVKIQEFPIYGLDAFDSNQKRLF